MHSYILWIFAKIILTMLFEDIIFGPIKSRRLGTSLGVNVLPIEKKYCNFNCVYCECGWNEISSQEKVSLNKKQEILKALEEKLISLEKENIELDSITFAGNGEPTIHPEFKEIVEGVVALRNKFCTKAKITVLSNATNLLKENVFSALQKVDNPILKLDAGREEMFYNISKADSHVIDFEKVKERLIAFGEKAIIQTLLIRGENEGKRIDNTSDEEFEAWLEIIKEINPRYVMLYPIDRVTPESKLEKLSKQEIELFAERVRAIGIEAKAY